MILLHDLYIGPNPIISNMDSLDLLGHQFLHWIPLHENNFIAMILSQEYTTLVSLHSTIMSEIPFNYDNLLTNVSLTFSYSPS